MLTEVPSRIQQIASDHVGHRLAVIVPVFNEETRVRRSVERLLEAAKADAWSAELILVDDCSSDGSCEVLKELAADNPEHSIKVVQHEINRGKGAAIRSGLQMVTANIVVIQDADLEYDPRDLSRLVQCIACDDADVVYGSRCLADSVNPRRWNTFAWGVSLLNMIVRILYGIRLTDEATCYKMFRTDDLLRMDLQCERFEFCPEVTAKAIRMGLKIVEVPIGYAPRSLDEGKKIRLSDGMQAIGTLWRYRNWRAVPQQEPQTSPLADSKHQAVDA